MVLAQMSCGMLGAKYSRGTKAENFAQILQNTPHCSGVRMEISPAVFTLHINVSLHGTGTNVLWNVMGQIFKGYGS